MDVQFTPRSVWKDLTNNTPNIMPSKLIKKLNLVNAGRVLVASNFKAGRVAEEFLGVVFDLYGSPHRYGRIDEAVGWLLHNFRYNFDYITGASSCNP